MQPKDIAKSIRKNLLSQKEKLEEYLMLLEKEDKDLIEEDPDKLIAHINLEKNIIDELSSFKKILTPLEVIYFNLPYKKDIEILNLKQSIESLSKNVMKKTSKNKEKLETIIVKIQAEIKGLSKKKLSRSSYNQVKPQMVDVNG